MTSDDLLDIERLMTRFLNAVSFEEGEQPVYRRLHDLFAHDARLIRNSAETPEIATVDEFIRTRQQTVDAGELTSFREVELRDTTELFGNVAHRLSVYSKSGRLNGNAFEARGVILTQARRC